MLIHITPKLYRPLEVGFVGQCSLKQVRIPELDLVLIEGEHLRTGTPWPNKHYYCGGPKSSRKQLFGFLVETRAQIPALTVICEWELDYWGSNIQTVEHTTKIVVLDEDHDAISTDVCYWHGMSDSLGGWENRIPANMPQAAPMWVNPCMWLFPDARQVGIVESEKDAEGVVTRCVQQLEVPTIQRERFRTFGCDRFPGLETAFTVTGKTHLLNHEQL